MDIPPPGWIVGGAICYDPKLITSLINLPYPDIIGSFQADNPLASQPIIALFQTRLAKIVPPTSVYKGYTDHLCYFCKLGDKSMIWQASAH
jgi:hypothetical protein